MPDDVPDFVREKMAQENYPLSDLYGPHKNTSTMPGLSRECLQSAIIGAVCMALLIAAAVLVSMWFGGGW